MLYLTSYLSRIISTWSIIYLRDNTTQLLCKYIFIVSKIVFINNSSTHFSKICENKALLQTAVYG